MAKDGVSCARRQRLAARFYDNLNLLRLYRTDALPATL
jgi:hypothetical protein